MDGTVVWRKLRPFFGETVIGNEYCRQLSLERNDFKYQNPNTGKTWKQKMQKVKMMNTKSVKSQSILTPVKPRVLGEACGEAAAESANTSQLKKGTGSYPWVNMSCDH